MSDKAAPLSSRAAAAPVRRLFADVLAGARDLRVLDEILAPDFVDRTAPAGLPAGREGVRAKLVAFHGAFPDAVFTLDALVAEGPLVAARSTWIGTHEGEFAGIAATGRRVTAHGMDFYRVADGCIVEHWDVIDGAAIIVQLRAGS